MSQDKRREHAVNLGNTIIGTAVMDPKQYADLAELIGPGDFPQPRQETVWRAIGRRIGRGEPVDMVSLISELQRTADLPNVNWSLLVGEYTTAALPDATWHASELAALARVGRLERQLAGALETLRANPGAHLSDVAPALQQLAAALDSDETTAGAAASGRTLRLTRASDIEAEPVVWAWTDSGEGRIPAGAMTVAAGREGTGKSSFGIWMAAQVTRGTLPGAFHGRPRAVFYVAVEDSWQQTIVPRLLGNGADLDLVYRVDAVEAEYGETTVSLPQDNAMLERAIREHDVALVVLDPLMSCIGKGIDTHRERDVRTALDPLARLADRTGAVLLGIAHFNKGSSTDPSSLITGSGAFKNVPRAVFGFARDDDNDCRVMTQAKNSLGRADLPSLAYNIVTAEVPTKKGSAFVGRFVFLGESTRTVDEILAAGPETDRSERDDAVEWLRGYLADAGGEAPSKDVKKAAAADDISERTLQRAMRKAGVTAERAGFGKGSIWRLDPDAATTRRDPASAFAPQSRHSRQDSEAGANGANGGANGADAQRPSLSVLANSAPPAALCTACRAPLDPVHAAAGETTCPGCHTAA